MADEGKGVAYAILGIVAVIAVVGLVLLFKGASGQVALQASSDLAKTYGGGEITHNLDQYVDPQGFVRYSDGRVESGAGYIYPERIQDTGGAAVPVPTIDTSDKRTGPILDNPCPYTPYVVKTTAVYAATRNCIYAGDNPNVGSEGRTPNVLDTMDYFCCTN